MATISERPEIAGVVHVVPDLHGDDRGIFVETYRREWFPHGREMLQGNRADRQAGALVGLHYHLHQADYWYVPMGTARVVLIPPGVAHGFAAITDMTITYLVDGYYNAADELGLQWDDPAVHADWGVVDPVLSARDRNNPGRADLGARRPYWGLRS